MNRFRTPALVALWVQVAAVFGLAAYALWHDQFGASGWLSGSEAFLAGLVLIWWTLVFARLTGPGFATLPHEPDARERDDLASGRLHPRALKTSSATRDGNWRALLLVYPWLTVLRGVLWGMTLLALLAGVAPTANPVALTALMTLWGAAIFASNASNVGLLRLAAEPSNPLAWRVLLDWLNLAAALSLAMAVMNVVPVKGFSETPELTSQVVYGVEGLLDGLATVLAFLTLRQMGPKDADLQATSP